MQAYDLRQHVHLPDTCNKRRHTIVEVFLWNRLRKGKVIRVTKPSFLLAIKLACLMLFRLQVADGVVKTVCFSKQTLNCQHLTTLKLQSYLFPKLTTEVDF